MLHQKARGRAKLTLAHKHAHTITCSTSLSPSHPHSPAKTSPARENLPRNQGGTSASLGLAQLPSNRVCPSSQSGALWEAHWPNETDYSEAQAAQWPGNSQEKKSGRCWRERREADAIGSQISALLWLVRCSLLCSHSYISLSASALALHVSALYLNCFDQLPPWPPCPQGNPLPKVKANTAQLKRDWFRQVRAEPILVTSLPRHIRAGLELVINNLLNNTSALPVATADKLVIVSHGPAQSIISYSLNNAAFDWAGLGGKLQDTN